MCIDCKKKNMVRSYTTHVVNIDKNVIVIKNVPCLECSVCGEVFYDDDTMVNIEEIVEKIKKDLMNDFIVDYKKVA